VPSARNSALPASKLLCPGSEELEVQVPVGVQQAVVPEHDDLVLADLFGPFHHQLRDLLEVTIEKIRLENVLPSCPVVSLILAPTASAV
jgi:hypothetical protein